MPKRNNQLGQGKYAPSAVRYRKTASAALTQQGVSDNCMR